MTDAQDRLTVTYGNGLSVTLAPGQPLRLSTIAWDFPERPDLIALAERQQRLEFLRDHLKTFCGLWDKLPRLFLDTYVRDIAECMRRGRPALEVLAAAHGGLFQPEDWCYAALCPLPHACLSSAPDAPDALVDFAFWSGAAFHAVFITSAVSQDRAQHDTCARLRDSGVLVTEIPGAELQRIEPGNLMIRLGAAFTDFWKGVPLPSSPFRIGGLEEILPA